MSSQTRQKLEAGIAADVAEIARIRAILKVRPSVFMAAQVVNHKRRIAYRQDLLDGVDTSTKNY